MWKSYINEFKSVFSQSKFHIIRFLGILIIPFIYGFFYVFAFWNPFEKINNIPIAVVTQKDSGQKDHLSEALGKSLKEDQRAEIGDIKVNLKAQHIYADISDEQKFKTFVKKNKDKYHAIIKIPPLDKTFENIIKAGVNSSSVDLLNNLFNVVSNLNSKNANNKIEIYNNYKKNYIISFGLDIAENSMSKNALLINIFSKIFQDQNYKNYLISQNIPQTLITHVSQILNSFNSVLNSEDQSFKLIHMKTHMSKHAFYGFGLAPFFVAIAIWVGIMAATFVIHPRVYNNKQSKIKTYFAKYFALVTISFLQILILFIGLVAIGFYQLNVANIFYMMLTMFFGSFIFVSIIQFIRWAMPTKLLGVLLIIILLILQMASNGGLFPIELQSTFYKVLNIVLPSGKLVAMIRESIFETNVVAYFKQAALLLIYPIIFIPLGLFVNQLKYHKWQQASLKISKKIIAEGANNV